MKLLHKVLNVALIAGLVLSAACSKVNGTVTPTATSTLPAITQTYTPPTAPTFTPTSTNAPNLEGRLFFDMNGSGLPDEASFIYDSARLNDSRQPLQPDLDKLIDSYILAHPNIKDGDLVTIEEPGLSNYTVCVQSDCVQTDPQGDFSIPNPSGASRASINITDPNAGTPALEMRYISDWNGPVIVPAYTHDVDAAAMATLTNIPGCDIDLTALVCKLNGTTLQIRDQHLNDTSVVPIGNGTSIEVGADNNVGLMQGFLTLPFTMKQVTNPIIWNNYDVLGPCNIQDGSIRQYNGLTLPGNPYSTPPTEGQLDGHCGLDYAVPIGTYVLGALPGTVSTLVRSDGENALFVIAPTMMNDNGHLSTFLISNGQQMYRGSIVALSGDSGYNLYLGRKTPQLHFDIALLNGENLFFDPFADLIGNPVTGIDYQGSQFSSWSVFNLEVFPGTSH